MDHAALALIDKVKPFTKSGSERLAHFIATLRKLDAAKVPGDLVECGVYRGGYIILARMLSPDRVCWLYDTFEGMTPPGPEDTKLDGTYSAAALYPWKTRDGRGWQKASALEVEENLRALGLYDPDRVRFVAGDVAETLPRRRPEAIALLRLDTDWFASTLVELKFLFPLLVPGGVLIVDDFGHWLGARKAVQEYFGRSIEEQLLKIDYTAVALTK